MSKFLFTLVLISALSERTWSYKKMTKEHGSVKISEACKRDVDCIENAFCRNQQNCLCDTSYSPSADKSVCTATSGLTCDTDAVCRTMSNATCRQGACTCKENFMLDIKNSSNCIPRPLKIGDFCQREDDCANIPERTTCFNDECHCSHGYKFINKTGECIQPRGINQRCTRDEQCLLNDETPDALECKNNQCVCKEGDSRCSSLGSLPTIAGIFLMFSLLLPRTM